MDKKTIIAIFVATFLALFTACLILNIKKQNDETPESVNIQKQEQIVDEDEQNEASTKEDISEEVAIKSSNSVHQAEKKQPSTPTTKETPIFDNIVVKEGAVVEEVEKDYGIKKEGNTIVITREFNYKSPKKYSFKDFGILDQVSTK